MAQRPSQEPDWATEESALKRNPTAQMQAKGWTTNDGTSDGIPEKPILEHTNGWMYNVSQWIKSLANQRTDPVGTVVSSVLTQFQFLEATEGNWVLCDGRNCVPSLYNELTGQTTVPNLVKKYLVNAGTNSNANIGFVGDLYETVTSQVFPQNSLDAILELELGNTSMNVNYQPIPTDGFQSPSNISSNNQKLYNYQLPVQESDLSYFYVTNPGQIPPSLQYYTGALVTGINGGAPTEGIIKYIQLEQHTHTYSLPETNFAGPINSFLTIADPFQDQLAEEDIRQLDFDYDEETTFDGLKVNYFIRIN